MIKDKNILIKNIYYMLSYAFQELTKNNYSSIEKEEFPHAKDLFAEILYRGVSCLLKQGLYREYIEKRETLPLLKGKLDINGTIRNRIVHKNLIACEFDELSENNLLNQILKATLLILIRAKEVNGIRKKNIKSILPFFGNIDTIETNSIRWDLIRYQKNNQIYKMLMNLCYFILEESIQTTDEGKYKMDTFIEKHMNRLFEKFVLQYFKVHYPKFKANADQIPWNINREESPMIDFLPTMQSDITLTYNGKTLIIDTKYYSQTLQKQFDKYSIHSGNLYQIYTYVKNRDTEDTGNVSGMLLYAKTNEEIAPKMNGKFGKNRILVDSLDLSVDFALIKQQLKIIASVLEPSLIDQI